MFICVLAFFAILLNRHEAKNLRKMKVFNTSLGSTQIMVELKLNILYLLNMDQLILLHEDEIQECNFTSDGAHFVTVFGDYDGGDGCKIICDSKDYGREIEISGCYMSFSQKSSGSGRRMLTGIHSISLSFKLNKNTKYEFLNYFIYSTIPTSQQEYLRVDLSNLTIQFQYSTRTCKMPEHKNENTTSIFLSTESTDEIYPCKPNDTERTTESTVEIYPVKSNDIEQTKGSTDEIYRVKSNEVEETKESINELYPSNPNDNEQITDTSTSVAADSPKKTEKSHISSTGINISLNTDGATHSIKHVNSASIKSSKSARRSAYRLSSSFMDGDTPEILKWIIIILSLAGTMSFLISVIQNFRRKRYLTNF
ncbi:hypothetical protein RF11_05643 [Thelohanellus kitauei]|uniref:CUB domain-containing protein n=1 Tax=Thelohanellus kitauei TaxID=669202 RepID=A0A0C2J7Q1_THEKT|nr:hypothetical protein RF11_05643 [Thelohanellus kitauei]